MMATRKMLLMKMRQWEYHCARRHMTTARFLQEWNDSTVCSFYKTFALTDLLQLAVVTCTVIETDAAVKTIHEANKNVLRHKVKEGKKRKTVMLQMPSMSELTVRFAECCRNFSASTQWGARESWNVWAADDCMMTQRLASLHAHGAVFQQLDEVVYACVSHICHCYVVTLSGFCDFLICAEQHSHILHTFTMVNGFTDAVIKITSMNLCSKYSNTATTMLWLASKL